MACVGFSAIGDPNAAVSSCLKLSIFSMLPVPRPSAWPTRVLAHGPELLPSSGSLPIIRRMINNSRWAMLALVLLGAGCEPKDRHPGALQGVVEFDEKLLRFEVGGRVTAIEVVRGKSIKKGDELAKLDDTLERASRESREARAHATRADVAVIRAGSRPEEMRTMQAQIRAAETNEALLQQNLARERKLLEQGAIARASVDDLEARVLAAVAERQALEQRLREL